MHASKWGVGLALATAWVLGGCGGKSSQMSLSARAGTTAAATSAETSSTGLKIDDHVTLTRVRIVIRDVKLEAHGVSPSPTPTPSPTPSPTPTAHADDSAPGGVEVEIEHEHGNEVEVHAGPVLIDLGADALTAAKLKEAVAVTVPAGTYDELRLKIHKLEDGEKTGDPEVDAARASVILDGTYDGTPFKLVSRVSANLKLEGTFTVAEEGASNITLDLDVSGWFSANGASLDPSKAANEAAIEDNIRKSLRAFDDHDHDGQDDHGGHGAEAGDDHGGSGTDGSGSGGSGSGGGDDGPNHT